MMLRVDGEQPGRLEATGLLRRAAYGRVSVLTTAKESST
jgi:hypothetical protein